MVIRRIAAVAAFLLCLLPLSCLTFASPPPAMSARPAQAKNITLEGKITEMTEGKLTVVTDEKKTYHVLYSDKTVISTSEEYPATVGDLHTGLKVWVGGSQADNEDVTANKIQIEGEAP